MTNAGGTQGEMSCRELVELVTDYLESGLAASERARFDAHLVDCTGCAEYLGQMRVTLQLSGTIDESSVEPKALETLLDAFRDWKKRS